ncbi:MAG: formyltransferase family protein [Acidobacteriota bacterium]
MPKSKSTLRLAFLGTGEIAIPSMERLVEAGHTIERVIVTPTLDDDDQAFPEDREGSVLGAWAAEKGLEVVSPDKPGSEAFKEELTALEPDLGVMAAFGRRFPIELLEVPRLGWIKAHFSMLPAYRGPYEVRSAISNGEKTLGASIIEVVDAGDTGPLVHQEELEVGPDVRFGDVAQDLAELGASLLEKTVASLAAGKKLKKKKQSERRSPPKAIRFTRRHQQPPWWINATAVYDRLRSLSPQPGLLCLIRRERVNILSGRPMEWVQPPYGEDGSFLGVRAGRLAILCGDSTVFGIERVRLEDGEVMSAPDVARHFDLRAGDRIV